MQPKQYQHKDFYLCAYLLVHKCILLKHERTGNSTTFTFQDTPELRGLVNDYYSMKGNTEPLAYSANIRSLKSIIHSNNASETLSTIVTEELNNEFNNNSNGKL